MLDSLNKKQKQFAALTDVCCCSPSSKLMMLPLAFALLVANFVQLDVSVANLVFPPGPALSHILSPAFASVTVVVPGVNVSHVLESVEYSKLTSGGVPVFAMLTVALGSSAVKQSPQ